MPNLIEISCKFQCLCFGSEKYNKTVLGGWGEGHASMRSAKPLSHNTTCVFTDPRTFPECLTEGHPSSGHFLQKRLLVSVWRGIVACRVLQTKYHQCLSSPTLCCILSPIHIKTGPVVLEGNFISVNICGV